jgi:hypothetical protein
LKMTPNFLFEISYNFQGIFLSSLLVEGNKLECFSLACFFKQV